MDWHDPKLLFIDSWAFYQLLVFLLGFYGWQFILTVRYVEWPLLTRRLAFKWALAPYIIARLALLGQLGALVAVAKRLKSNIPHCANTLRWLCIMSNVSVSASSGNLFVRTVTIWYHKRWVQAFLALAMLGQWAMSIISAVTHLAHRDGRCGDLSETGQVFEFYLYTTIYDAVVLVFTVAGLSSFCSAQSSQILVKMHQHGVWYFVISLTVNITVLVFAGLNFNLIMSVLFTVPAAVICVISSSQAVISLMKLSEESVASKSPARNTASGGKGTQLTTNIELNLTGGDWSVDAEIQSGGAYRSSKSADMPLRDDETTGRSSLSSVPSSLGIIVTPVDDDASMFGMHKKRSISPRTSASSVQDVRQSGVMPEIRSLPSVVAGTWPEGAEHSFAPDV